MTVVRKTLIWILAIVLALIVIAILFITFFNWNRARPFIDHKVSAAIGRPFAINGDLSVHWARNPEAGGIPAWVPWPRFTARDVSVANPAWAKKKHLHLDIAVEPLGKPIPLGKILARDAAGKAPPPRSGQSYHIGWVAHGTWRGATAKGSGKIGSVLSVRNTTMPFPLQADLRLRDLHITLEGTLTDPAHLAALNLRLKMSGANMAHLYPLTGVILPDTPPFSTDGHLTGNLHPGASVFRYRDFNGKVGASDLHGTMMFATAPPRPKLTGTIASERLRFSDLAPLIGAGSAKKSGVSVQQPPDKLLPVAPFLTDRWKAMDADVHFTGKHIVRKAELPISNLSTHLVMQDGVLTLDPLRFGVAGGSLDSDIRLDGSAKPMKGRMKISLRGAELKKLFPTVDLMKSSLGEINGDAALAGTGNSIAKLLGTSDGQVKLLVDGGTVSKLLLEEAGLNLGSIVLTKLTGDKPVQINCVAADFDARDGVWHSTVFLFDTETMTINVDGSINLGSERLDLTLHPHSKGLRLLSLRSPLYVRGTLKHPDAGVEKGPLLARAAGAAVLGTVAAPLTALAALIAPSHESNNRCAALIARMRKPAKAPAEK